MSKACPTSSLDAVSCLSKAQCVAVGATDSRKSLGVIVTVNDGVPGPVQEVQGTVRLTSIDCVSTTTCYAAGDDVYEPPGAPTPNTGGAVVTIENGSAADVRYIPVPEYGPGQPGHAQLYGIGCSGTTCMAVGYAGALGGFAINTGRLGNLFPISEDNVNGIECVPGDWCVLNAQTEEGRDSAIGLVEKVGIGHRYLHHDTAAGATHTTLHGGDCHQRDLQFCLVAGSVATPTGPGLVLTAVGSGGAVTVTVPGTKLLNDISCASSYWCVAVGQSSSDEGALVPVGWATPGGVVPVAGTSTFNGVSCAATGYCVAVGTGATGGVVDSFRVWG